MSFYQRFYMSNLFSATHAACLKFLGNASCGYGYRVGSNSCGVTAHPVASQTGMTSSDGMFSRSNHIDSTFGFLLILAANLPMPSQQLIAFLKASIFMGIDNKSRNVIMSITIR
jgi:hypothetical protein